MPLTNLASLSTLYTQTRAFIRTRFPTRGVNDAQFLGKMSRVLSIALLGVQQTLESIDRDSPPSSKSSTAGINAWAFTYGVPSNGGGYGGNVAEPSSGGLAPVTGTGGTTVVGSSTPGAGQQLFAPDGVTVIQLLATGVIPFTGSFFAITPGTVGNLPIGTILTWVSPPSGCDASVTLSAALVNGLDAELTGDLLDRTLERLQVPPKGGANVDYDGWALAVPGVFAVYVYPRRSGTGTVDLVITVAGNGTSRQPSGALITAVQAAIALVNPTNLETVTVLSPYMPASQALGVIVRAVPSVKYTWDWNDSVAAGGHRTVASYNGGTPSVTLNAAAPGDLIAAIAAGLRPRIQVDNTATVPLFPDTRRVVSIDGSHLILTLDSPLSASPNVGDTVYAGSYITTAVGQAVLNYINALGPSRASGLADAVTSWGDFVSTMSIAGAAEDALDTDGITKLVSRVALGGVTLNIGYAAGPVGGGDAVQDYQVLDDGANAPQLAYASRILIVQPQ